MTEVSTLLTFQCLKGEFDWDFEIEKLRTNLKKGKFMTVNVK